MDKWWSAASLQQCTRSCIRSPAKLFGETSNHPGDSAPLQPRIGALWLLAFPQTKITFEREEISDSQWDSGKYDRAANGNWENCVRSQGAYFEGDWGVIVLCTMSLVSCIFFNQCLYFSYYMTGYLLDRPYIHIYIFFFFFLSFYYLYRSDFINWTHMCNQKSDHERTLPAPQSHAVRPPGHGSLSDSNSLG